MPEARRSRETRHSSVDTQRLNEIRVPAAEAHRCSASGPWADRPSRRRRDDRLSRSLYDRRRSKSRPWGPEEPPKVGFGEAARQPDRQRVLLGWRGRGNWRAGKRRRAGAAPARRRCVPRAAVSFGLRLCGTGELFFSDGLPGVSHRTRGAVHRARQCFGTRAMRSSHWFVGQRQASTRPAVQWQEREQHPEEPGRRAHGTLGSGAAQYKELPNPTCQRTVSTCDRAVLSRLDGCWHA